MNRRILQVLDAVALGRVDQETTSAARFLVAEYRDHRRRAKERTRPSRNADEAARLQARAVRDRVRAEVMARSEGSCELCGSTPLGALEWHHLLPGPARRRLESTSTTLATCMDCHRAWHRGDLETLERSLTWAKEHSTTMTVQDLEKRIGRRRTVRP